MTDNLLDQSGETETPEIDLDKDYLAELTKQGGKFDKNKYSSELEAYKAIARGKYEGDQYVEILKKRLDTLSEDYKQVREENVTRAQLEDLINQIQSKQQLASSEDTPANEDITQPKNLDIESLVSSKIQEHELSKKQSENFNLVKDKLQQRYGKNYKDAVKQQIDELGITEAELNELARKTPKMLIKTLGLDDKPQQETFTAPPRSSQRDTFTPSGPKKRTWAFYQELRKTDPNAWLDRNTAIQMQKDALELGEEFKDGDYHKYGPL